MKSRVLVVAPSWVGDAILSEPLIARLRALHGDSNVDVLAPAWCRAVYERTRGLGRVIGTTLAHGRIDLGERRALAKSLSAHDYGQAVVLPNSWKSALIPWLARIPRRTGYVGEMRWGLINDARRLHRDAIPRLVDRYAALGAPAGKPVLPADPPLLLPDVSNRTAALEQLGLGIDRAVAILCPGAEFGPAKRWPAEHFGTLAQKLIADGYRLWIIGSANDKPAAVDLIRAAGKTSNEIRDLCGKTNLGTAIDLLSLARVVVSNDSGLMHAAAAVGAPVVALFGSSSPSYTPPMSPLAKIARIDIECSPCFKRECPLGHFKCMRDLEPSTVYDLARAAPQRLVELHRARP